MILVSTQSPVLQAVLTGMLNPMELAWISFLSFLLWVPWVLWQLWLSWL